ncbi:hypothetical protein AYK20_05470 [Thermoplasmatales archaeon SG8-52-1]|nr:MAG: hypothetical protein AYK20_05470 [Thermoplasmatales archaeon SG8-52-1]
MIDKSLKKFEESNNGNFDLLILAPKQFKKLLKPLVAHKNKFGIETKLVTLDFVYEKIWYGRDNAEKIKYFIKETLDNSGIKYVLLVGGIKKQISKNEIYWLPVRYIYLSDRWGGTYEWGNYLEKKFLSDLYFADIYDSKGEFSSWDTDCDGIYGEWKDNESAEDILDLNPDVCVGRLPCRNRLEVKIMVKKIINYEKVNNSNSEWFNKMVVVAGDTYLGNDIYEGEDETQQALDVMPGFNHIKLWTSEGGLTGPKDVIKTWNNGCGFIYFAGHGSPYNWGTYPPNEKPIIYGLKLQHIKFLFNGKKLPICIVGGCHNSMFNVSLLNSNNWTTKLGCYECFSWRLTRKIGGGSIATIGNTALGYGSEDKLNPNKGGGGGNLTTFFFEAIGMNKIEFLGEAWSAAISQYIDKFPILWDENSNNDTTIDAKTVTQWVLMGDPSLKIGGYPKIDKKID